MTLGMLRNRLKPRYNKNFVKFRANTKRNKANELHHIAGSIMGGKKLNDYLLAELDNVFHTVITYNREPTQDEVDEMMLDALNGIFDYIEDLEKTIILLNAKEIKTNDEINKLLTEVVNSYGGDESDAEIHTDAIPTLRILQERVKNV